MSREIGICSNLYVRNHVHIGCPIELQKVLVKRNQGELKTELAVFDQHRLEWLRSNPGKFVVITGTRVEGFYSDYESAFRAGVRAGISGSFLVKQICAEEPVYLIY